MRRLKVILALIILLIMLGIQLPFAEAKGQSAPPKNLVVPAGQTVDNFFSIGHNATINGTVKNLVLVVGGNLTIHRTAKINELIIVIGGSVINDNGTHVTENIFSFAWNKRVIDAFLFGGAVLLSSWVAKLFFAILLIFFSTLAGLFVPDSREKKGQIITWKIWLTGIIASIWLLVLIVILAVTLIGIPLALLLLIIPIVSFLLAAGTISQEIGKRLIPEKKGNWTTVVLGAFILAALLELPLIGLLFYLGLTILSLGHLVHWISSKWQHRHHLKSKES